MWQIWEAVGLWSKCRKNIRIYKEMGIMKFYSLFLGRAFEYKCSNITLAFVIWYIHETSEIHEILQS